ncbi:MAG: prepilin-type N-terminal cleavage/methylation domain-containing protein [Planctomycetota bacterium]|jgi:prepilin-type N-terminal cleavage/methylation domain-containing protein
MSINRIVTRRGGFTLVEVMVAFVLLSVAMMGFSRSVVSSMMAANTDREVRKATEASRGVMERLSGANFEDLFELYNGNALDDPDGAGTAPGPTFSVTGLTLQDDDDDGMVGEVLLPFVQVGGVWIVREDLDLPELGLPQDLSGDGVIDSLDHSDDYLLLPARIRIQWKAAGAPAQVEFHTILMGV